MTFNKEYKDFQAQSLVIRQKLAEAEELSREDIDTVVNLTAFDFMDSSSLRASVMIFGKIIYYYKLKRSFNFTCNITWYPALPHTIAR